MKDTRKLVILEDVSSNVNLENVLCTLLYKGLITYPLGTCVTDEMVDSAFSCNKSVLCAKKDYIGKKQAVTVPICIDRTLSLVETALIFSEGNINAQFEGVMNSLNIDVGDSKSNVSVGREKATTANCAYCNYLKNSKDGYNERTVYRSKNFFVMPTVGEFCKGYLLIIPNEHVMSNAELPKEVLDEFEEVLKDIKLILALTYRTNKFLIWENGSGHAGKNKAKDSIVHSHVHIAPSLTTASDIQKLSGFNFKEIEFSELKSFETNPYLLISNEEKGNWIICDNPNLYIPRQYVRQILGEEYGIHDESWNWRTHPFSDLMHATVVDISTTIKECHEFLPERILRNTGFAK